MLADYCNLCTMLPNISVELGLKAAELIKFLNSRICQLVLGAGAISVSGLKTITIRNLALALRSLQLVVNVIPHVLIHFQKCHSERNLVSSLIVGKIAQLIILKPRCLICRTWRVHR